MDSLRSKMTSLTPFARKHKVCVVGSGNWGSTIAKVVAENTAAHPELFEKDVQMWVYEETIQLAKTSKLYDSSSEWSTAPQKLTALINHFHQNVKYLPDIPLPHNVIANPSVTDSVKDCTILIFNLPHQFIEGICKQLRGHILPYARGISCIKGVNVKESSISLFSETIGQELGIYCGALSGANIANEVAKEKFCETTIAYDPPAMDSQYSTPVASAGPSPSSSHVDLASLAHKDSSGKTSKVKLRALPPEYTPIDQSTFKALFHRRYFHVRVVSDVAGVSLGGALKNIVAVAAGWVDGLGWGDNAKAAVMRVGLLEMVDFGKRFFPKTINPDTFTVESAGVADLITTCAGGRNHRCAKMSIEEGKPISEIEARELNGQKLQGTLTAVEVNAFLKSQGAEKDYPLLTAVYNILQGKEKVEDLPDLIEPEDESNAGPPDDRTLTSSFDEPPPSSLQTTTNQLDPRIQPQTPTKSHNLPPSAPSKPSPLISAPALASSRYNRQLLVPSLSLRGQELLSQTKILIIGLGGLGCPAALYLAGAGVHTLSLVDADTVELSNLHRQILHREDSVGWTKVASAIRTLKGLNSEVRCVGYETRLSAANALDIVRGCDIVLDCTDNPATRYLISDACVLLRKPLISGAAQRADGQLMVLNFPVGVGPCYRCIFPKPPAPETVQGCGEIGVLGPVVGVIGILMASEAIRLVGLMSDGGFKPSLLLHNAARKEERAWFRVVGLRGRRKECVGCGDGDAREVSIEAFQQGRMDYEAFCGSVGVVSVLGEGERVGAGEFLGRLRDADMRLRGNRDGEMEKPSRRRRTVVVDVREPHEIEVGPKVLGAVNVPMSRILRGENGVFDGLIYDRDRDEDGDGEADVFFVCQRGNDSQLAARKMLEERVGTGKSMGWVGDVRGGFVALEREVAGGGGLGR